MSRNASIEERFWDRVMPEPNSGCWLWTGAMTRDGYSMMPCKIEGRSPRAHRFSYELHNGPIPDELIVDHLCRVRQCVNPAHMELVTPAENVLRGEGLSAQNKRKTHCKFGHPFNGDNLIVHPIYGRSCRACRVRMGKKGTDKKKLKIRRNLVLLTRIKNLVKHDPELSGALDWAIRKCSGRLPDMKAKLTL